MNTRVFDEDEDDRPTLDTRVPPHVRIINASLDESQEGSDKVVISGRIDPATLRFLKVDGDYQRPLSDRADIFAALQAGVVVPSIDVGVRGQDFDMDGSDVVICSPAYIIDGWQRVGNALRILELSPGTPIRIFATVHFGTDPLWERHRFTALNKNVKKVSPSLHLRNMRDTNAAVLTLYGLCHNDRDFALYRRVCWSQNMGRSEIMTALSLARGAAHLHLHATRHVAPAAELTAAALLRAADNIGLNTFRQNVKAFFGLIDECWGIRSIEYSAPSPQIKLPFVMTLGRVLSNHLDFWEDEYALRVDADTRRKFAKFSLTDPYVRGIASSHGKAMDLLYEMIVAHVNSGRRTHHLRSRFAK